MGSKKDKDYLRISKPLAEEIGTFLFQLGTQFVKINNAEAAQDCFKYSVDLHPTNQPAVYNLATLYAVCRQLPQAERIFKEALRMAPNDLLTKISLGEVHRKLSNWPESKRLFDEVLRVEPDNVAAVSAKALLHYDCGELAQASEFNARALELNPHDNQLVLNKALLGMTFGDWPKWWGVYETCLSYGKHNSKMRSLKQQESWDGSPMPGATMLVISDQGAGDAIQFARFLPEAKARGQFDKLLYLVQGDVAPLVSMIPGIDKVYVFGRENKIDRSGFVSLLGAMRALGVSKENCSDRPPLITDPKLDVVWEARTNREWDGSSKKVGLCWAGDPRHGNDHARSMALATLLPVLKAKGCQFFSFQVGKAADQLFPLDMSDRVPDFGSQFRDYSDTASALKQMDYLVTVDTSIAHTAGAVGVKTLAMLAAPSEWRWLTDRSDSPWYDSVELFRQQRPGDWSNVVEAIVGRLES